MTTNILSVTNLCKNYGDMVAVDHVTFDIKRNEIVGLLGPNGAGKTTTINMILGVLESDSGTIDIEEWNLKTHRPEALDRANFAAVYAPLPGNLTVTQNLRVFGLIYGEEPLRTNRIPAQSIRVGDSPEYEVRSAFIGRTNAREPRQSHHQSAASASSG
jgi:ABC-2 type transport system ATP-binding protein